MVSVCRISYLMNNITLYFLQSQFLWIVLYKFLMLCLYHSRTVSLQKSVLFTFVTLLLETVKIHYGIVETSPWFYVVVLKTRPSREIMSLLFVVLSLHHSLDWFQCFDPSSVVINFTFLRIFKFGDWKRFVLRNVSHSSVDYYSYNG